MTRATYDAVVVGAGPNGLAAAVELARGGVHGMCGWHAARTALRRTFGR